MLMVAIRVPHVMLHVANELLRPVENIKRAVGRNADADRPKVGVIGFDEVFDRLALQAGAFFADFRAKDSLKADDVAVEEISLKGFREMPAGKDAGAGTRA